MNFYVFFHFQTLSVVVTVDGHGQPISRAKVVMRKNGDGEAVGQLMLTDLGNAGVRLQGILTNIDGIDEFVGLHVHEYGDLGDGCMSAGDHYNPTMSDHGDLNGDNSHVGDFGNVQVADGQVTIDLIAQKLRLNYGPSNCAVGRALVVSYSD